MLFNILFALIIIVLFSHTINAETEITLPIKERIELLKFKFVQDLKRTTFRDATTIVNEDIDYVAIDAITPISRNDDRIKDQLYKLPQLKTTKVTTIKPWDKEPEQKIYDDINEKIIILKKGPKNIHSEETSKSLKRNKKHGDSESYNGETAKENNDGSEEVPSKIVQNKKNKLKLKIKPKKRSKKDSISKRKKNRYKVVKHKNDKSDKSEQNKGNERTSEENEQTDSNSEKDKQKYGISKKDTKSRRLITQEMMNSPIQGVHCQKVITPYLIGIKKNFDDPLHVTSTDRNVVRFLDLLKMNMTGYSREDTYAILYQISETQVRLFQWDVPAIRDLFSAIAGDGQRHTFQTLKYGLREKFKMWHLDLHWNITTLIKDTLLFRPYCLDNRDGGSTLSSKVSRFIKSTTPTTNDCDDD